MIAEPVNAKTVKSDRNEGRERVQYVLTKKCARARNQETRHIQVYTVETSKKFVYLKVRALEVLEE